MVMRANGAASADGPGGGIVRLPLCSCGSIDTPRYAQFWAAVGDRSTMPRMDTPATIAAFDIMLGQMNAAMRANLFMPALITALTLPDICAALQSNNGETNGDKYKAWVSEYVLSDYDGGQHGKIYDPEIVYRYRCSLLHQGSGLPNRNAPGPRMVFGLPGGSAAVAHAGDFKGHDQWIVTMDVPFFLADVDAAVRRWLAAVGSSENVTRNLENHAHYRPDGLPPLITGWPLVG
jgi:hypothetical protein